MGVAGIWGAGIGGVVVRGGSGGSWYLGGRVLGGW